MGKTINEHFVPQCYLRNFKIIDSKNSIHVFDKRKNEIRVNQNIGDVASERYFYDIKIDKILEELSEEGRNAFLIKLGDKYESYKKDETQHLEKFFCLVESYYSDSLKYIIEKAENATPWYIKECHCMVEDVKIKMAFFITLQYLRTKKTRNMFKQAEEGIKKKIFSIHYNSEYPDDLITPEDLKYDIGKNVMKIKHAEYITDPQFIGGLFESFLNHIWVVYINRTEIPFWTSDAPIALNSYNGKMGVAAKGIQIALPLSSKVLLGMYDKKIYSEGFSKCSVLGDRFYIEVKDTEKIKDFNLLQLFGCDRTVFSNNNDFNMARMICEMNPKIMKHKDYISVM